MLQNWNFAGPRERCFVLALLLHASLSASFWCLVTLEDEIQPRPIGFAGAQQAQLLAEDLTLASAHREKSQYLYRVILS